MALEGLHANVLYTSTPYAEYCLNELIKEDGDISENVELTCETRKIVEMKKG